MICKFVCTLICTLYTGLEIMKIIQHQRGFRDDIKYCQNIIQILLKNYTNVLHNIVQCPYSVQILYKIVQISSKHCLYIIQILSEYQKYVTNIPFSYIFDQRYTINRNYRKWATPIIIFQNSVLGRISNIWTPNVSFS